MLSFTKTIVDPSGIVSKLIFEDETAIAETVVYSYLDRGVICFSVQSGCKVGCTFCGTGKRFIRDLTYEEMILQIEKGLSLLHSKTKIQIMSMSMGEPVHNFDNIPVIEYLNKDYYFFISSVGIKEFDYSKIYQKAKIYDRFGMQFSLHHWNEIKRKKLLGNYSGLLPIVELVNIAKEFKRICGRNLYFNYIAKGGETEEDALQIYNIVKSGHITISVLCSKTPRKSDSIYAKELAKKILNINSKQSIKLFDPAGQDTIGGGCGQLFYVQEKLRGKKCESFV